MHVSATRTRNTPKRKLKASASEIGHDIIDCADKTTDWALGLAFAFVIVLSLLGEC